MMQYSPMDCIAALADPTRRRIVELLSRGERGAGEIVAKFGATAPAISQHLKVLREAGLVRVRAEGQRRIYRLDTAGWDEVEEWVRKVRRFWKDRLDGLEAELGKPERKQRARKKR